MDIDGLILRDIDGLHEDGWCSQLLRVRIEAARQAETLGVKVWIKPEDAALLTPIISITLDSQVLKVFEVPFGQLTDLVLCNPLAAGQELSFRVFCTHSVPKVGEDGRSLSFMLNSIYVQ